MQDSANRSDGVPTATGVVLTVAAGKRLIAKAVAQLPEVQEHMKKGMLVIAKGSTNAYVVEELFGKKIDLLAYRSGVFMPKNADEDKGREGRQPIPDIVLQDGAVRDDLDRFNAVEHFQAGDVYIKGANALDYWNDKAGIMVGASDGGTIGAVIGHLVGKRAQLIIPVGLEKLVYEDIDALHRQLQAAHSDTWRLFPVTGTIVTEIEALGILAGVRATLAGAGGIGGAEGCVALFLEGTEESVAKAKAVVESVQGEPRILERG